MEIVIKPYRNKDGRIVAVSNAPNVRTRSTTVVAGPPAAGKTTYVAQHKKAGDIVLDLDAICFAIGSGVEHGHEKHFYPLAYAARDGILERLKRTDIPGDVWVIGSLAKSVDRHAFPNARVIVLETDETEAIRRSRKAGRPKEWAEFIATWWQTYERHIGDIIITNSEVE